MATSGEKTALRELSQETICPLCLDFFKQPMSLSCGHNFCRDCLAQLGAEVSCPQCRAKVEPSSACPNRALANMVCLVKRLQMPEGAQEESSGQRLCQEHRQSLQIFCSNEKSLLCPGCLGRHQGHPLLSLPEAAQEYKDLLDGLLESLRKEEQKLLHQRQAEEQSRQECQEQFATEKQQVGLALESLQELLQESQSVWLDWLAEQEKKMEAEWGVALAQLSGKAACLQQLMAQTKRKYHQPDGEFLQDIQDTIDRCQNYLVGHVESAAPRLQGKLWTLLEKNASVRQIVDSYKASLQTTLTRENLEQLLTTAPAPEQPRSPKDVPGRFDQEFCVLGSEGFTTGWHWWEVSVQGPYNFPVRGRACWAIGVAKESIRRKGRFCLHPQEGIWAVGKSNYETVAFGEVKKEYLGFQAPLQRLWPRLVGSCQELHGWGTSTDQEVVEL
ncbi:hypothetical protein E2320_014232 [Naja naja]|nr:hypothetical protein E2320_014232 [Naja naja]